MNTLTQERGTVCKMVGLRKLALVIICLAPVMAHAQSYYNDEDCDADFDDCSQIDTAIFGDPGVTKCTKEAVILSTLNGNHATSSGVYPNAAEVQQVITGAQLGVTYPWNFTEYLYTPSGEGCGLHQINWSWPISITLLNFALYSQNLANETCTFNQSCSPPLSNPCATEFPSVTTPAPPEDVNGGFCFKYQFYYALILKGTDKSVCLLGAGTDSKVATACY